MTLPAPNGLGKALISNSGPCNVVLRLFRMFSLGQRVRPATMIEFKEIEYFDHTGILLPTPRRGSASRLDRAHLFITWRQPQNRRKPRIQSSLRDPVGTALRSEPFPGYL